MKKMFLKCFMLAAGLMIIPSLGVRASEEQGSYWSEASAPVIYGTTEISIPEGTVFELEDTRFRVFAKDFEDGDLTKDITAEHNVNSSVAGEYEITYTVSDVHNNETVLKVPVRVTAEGEAVEVTRTLFTNPSVWNMDQAGTNRSNYHDSQHLGIYVPKDASVDIKIKKGNRNLDLKFYGNDSWEESGFTVKNNGAWQTFKNTNNKGTFDSVPFIMTPVMSKGADLRSTFEVELKYNDSVKELNYYHQGDDEAEFKNEWREEQDTYAVFENDVVTVVMPITDIDLLTNYHERGFESLEQFGEYWQKVVTRMDQLIGLEMKPSNPVHQDVPTRFLVKANRHGAGAAYYSGTHVGINSQHIHPFFEMNWGGLHEFAHGYQGSLGKGVMGLGEVSNNILGRYIQLDKEIYFHQGDWLGSYAAKEDAFNKRRLEGKGWEEQPVDVRLYMVCNLFDTFEGGETYAKMFRWYREKLDAGITMTNTDAYVGAMADLYQVNIIPYMEAWGLTVGDEVRQSVNSRKLPLMNMLGDMVEGEQLSSAMAALTTNEKYKIVRNSAISSFEGNVNVSIQVDDFSAIQGKELKFHDGDVLVSSVPVNSNPMQITLPLGNYRVTAPVHEGAASDAEYAFVKAGDNELSIVYTNYSDYSFDTSKTIKVSGIHGTYGYNLTFNKDYSRATLSYGGANIGTDQPYVKIYNAQQQLIAEDRVTKEANGSACYFDFNKGTQEFEITEGDIIEVYHPNTSRVHVFLNSDGKEIPQLKPVEAVTRYEVTGEGIKRSDMTEEEIAEINYSLLRPVLVKTIEDYQATATPQELLDLTENRSAKEKVLVAYINLKEEDKGQFDEIITRIKEGPFAAATKMNILGIHGTVGIEMQLNEAKNRAYIKMGYADMGSTAPYLAIYDADNNEITREVVTNHGSTDYFDFNSPAYEVFLKPGYVIEVKGQNSSKIVWKDAASNVTIEDLAAEDGLMRYVVTKDGIVKEQ